MMRLPPDLLSDKETEETNPTFFLKKSCRKKHKCNSPESCMCLAGLTLFFWGAYQGQRIKRPNRLFPNPVEEAIQEIPVVAISGRFDNSMH